MVTEKQAHENAISWAERATERANIHWQLVVDELEQKIAELEAKLDNGGTNETNKQ